jgi:hypothetical protein
MMPQTAKFGPFFAMMFLTLLVWVYMYIKRIGFIRSNKISPRDLAVPGALARLSPAAVSNPSDNLKNLFEIPVLFYALALYLFVTYQVDAALLISTCSLPSRCGSLRFGHCSPSSVPRYSHDRTVARGRDAVRMSSWRAR